MRVVRLKRFLTYQHNPRAVVLVGVVAGGGVVWSWQGVVGRCGVMVGHTVLLDACRRLGHGVGMVGVRGVVVLLVPLRSSRWGDLGLGCRRSRTRRLSH